MEADNRRSLIEENKSERLEPNQMPSQDQPDGVTFDFWFWIRAVLILCGLAFVMVNAVYGFVMPNTNVDCLLDKAFEITSGFNKYLQDNATPRHVIIAISSLCVDFVIVYMSIHWAFWGRSWRMVFAIVIFYMFRAAVQNIFQMKYPEGYLWEYPGFPSLTISYLKTNDFFFSGHVGFPIIIAMECHNLGKSFMVIFCFLTCGIEAFTMIVTRGHYCIDLITGMIFSHYVYILVEKHIDKIDSSCIGMKKTITNEPSEPEFKPVPICSNPTLNTNPTTVSV